MKRAYILLVVAVLAVVVSAVVWAAESQPMAPAAGEQGMMMGTGRMGPTSIAISDKNDVYVVVGGMILKYDADLNLVKQAELPAVERPAGRMGGRMGRGGGGGGGGRGGGGGGRGGMRRGGGAGM